MPVIDRYLEVIQKQRAEALVFAVGAAVEMIVGGQSRSVSSKPATSEQIHAILTEILPDYPAQLSTGSVTYPHSSVYGNFKLQIERQTGGVSLRILPAASSAQTLSAQTPPPAATAAIKTTPAHTASTPSGGPVPGHLDELFHQMLDMKASDLHLKSGKAPMVRVDGSMAFMPDRGPIDGETLNRLLYEILPEKNREEFKETNDTDFGYELGERSRMRANVFRDIAGIGGVFRQIPTKILTAKQLNLPSVVLSFCDFDKGLVVVTGPTGSGKSTTLAAMIDYINDTRDDHLITIEDPVEFVHKDKQCHINQREVGTHTRGFKQALRAALREDPDIVLVGEMRDLETVAIAIETAETGHLVFGTLHTNTAASTVDRLIDQFPADRQQQVRTMLAESLKGIVAQTLLKRKGGGRVAALEILVVTGAISNLIREGKTFQIPSIMQTGKGLGMQTLNDALLDLVKSDTVEPQEAYDRSVVKKDFGMMLTRSGFKGPWSEEKTG
ncbi:MAG: type IV pilus twitching motility protein PilT [Desulfuromonadales bacterium]